MGDSDFRADTVTVIGTGLLGASLGLALKRRYCSNTIIGVNRSEAGAQAALESGGVDVVTSDAADAVRAADLVVLCTPVGIMGRIMEQIAPALQAHALVTDVGSTKQTVVRDIQRAWPGAARFVGAHPMAGGEKKGAADARAGLFEGATVVLTPTGDEDDEAVHQAMSLWETVGGRVSVMTPEAHDWVVARTSHIPHLMASVLTSLIARLDDPERAVIGAGFLDTTRVASGDPEMWRDICLANADAILHVWSDLDTRLAELHGYLEAGDGDALLRFFAQWRDLRADIGDANKRNTE